MVGGEISISMKKITFICGFSFPIGYSGSNRLLSLARGLKELGNNTNVIILFPTEKKSNIINERRGVYYGIDYMCPYFRNYKLKNKILNKFDIFIAIIYSYINIILTIKKHQIIINTSDEPWIVFLFSKLKYFNKNLKLYFIVDEFPPEMRYRNKKSISLFSKFLFKKSLKAYDGLISMTKALIDFYDEYFYHKNYIQIPITVETDRFRNFKIIENSDYIAYIGNFDNSKDGLDFLIWSFNIFNKKYPDIILKLAGEGAKKDLIYIKNIIEELNLNNKVEILGKMHRDSVPDFLCNSKMLVMSRPLSDRNNAGFPTKLGEYLSTGVPVVVTSIGEIPLFLKDSINVFLAKPNNINDFSSKMIKVFDDYDYALRVASEGKNIAENTFNYKVQSLKLNNFLNQINI